MKQVKEGDHCRHCNTVVRLRKRSNRKRNGKYWYTHYFWCDNCKAIYFNDKFKVNGKKKKKYKQPKIDKRVSILEEKIKQLEEYIYKPMI